MKGAEDLVNGHRVLGKEKDGSYRSVLFKSQRSLMKECSPICIVGSHTMHSA